MEFGRGPRLWDAGVATGEVCCAAFQLGACEHTESGYFDELADWADEELPDPHGPALCDVCGGFHGGACPMGLDDEELF